MSSGLYLRLVTACAFAIAVSFPAFAGAARDHSVVATEFSAQQKKDEKDKDKKVSPSVVGPKVAPHLAPKQGEPRVIRRQVMPQGGGQNNLGSQKTLGKQKSFGPKVTAPVTGTPKIGASKTARKTFTPRGKNSNVVNAARIRSAPPRGAFRTTIRGHNYSVWRSAYRARHGNRWRTFIALSALGAIAIGGAEFYPYAYIDAPEDYCDGLTEDGCQLVYDEVETMEGDVVPQCVAYCPWR